MSLLLFLRRPRIEEAASLVIYGTRKDELKVIEIMQPERLAMAPRCLVRTRMWTECQSPAVRGRSRCRMHGGTNPGAPSGNRNAWKHGGRSGEAEGAARMLRAMARLVQAQDTHDKDCRHSLLNWNGIAGPESLIPVRGGLALRINALQTEFWSSGTTASPPTSRTFLAMPDEPIALPFNGPVPQLSRMIPMI